jgi:multiple sugar transport system substrate-binding protein
MKESKKIILSASLWLIVLLSLPILLNACSVSETKQAGSGHQTESAIRLQFSFWGSGEELAMMRSVISEFEATHPDIDIIPVHIPDNYFQKLHILIAGDLAPDVMMVNSLYLPVYADNGAFLPLVMPTQKQIPSAFYPQAQKAMTWKGHLYALPRDISNLVVYANLDLLRQHGLSRPAANWTLVEFKAMAKRVVRPPSADHPSGVFGVSFFEKPLYWLPWVWSFGGDVFNADFTQTYLDDPKTMAGIQAYADWVLKDQIAPSKQQVGQQGMSQLFADGHLAFFISGRWSVPFLREKARFQWDVLPLPRGPKGSVVGIDASGYAVSAKTTHPDAAQEFVAYLTSARALTALTQSGLIVPSRRDLAESAAFLNSPANASKTLSNRVFLQSIPTGYPTHTPPNWDEVSEVLGLGLEPVWDGRLSAHDALEKLQRDVSELLPHSREEAR